MKRFAALFAAALVLAACSREEVPDEDPAAAAAEPVVADVTTPEPQPTDGAAEGRAWRYTSLTECEIVREELEEMPYVETLCPGPAGWSLRITDSDARQNLIVVAPGGRETSLELARVGGGGFSSLGETAEWRAPAGAPLAPDSLIVRYRVAVNPYPEPETPFLLAVDLAPRPCVVARVAPGSAQNAIARARADDPGACLGDRSLR